MQKNLDAGIFDLTQSKYINNSRLNASSNHLIYGKDYDYIVESMNCEYKLDVKQLEMLKSAMKNTSNEEEKYKILEAFKHLYPEANVNIYNLSEYHIPDTVFKKVYFVQSPKGENGLPSKHYSLKEKLLSDFRAERSIVKKQMAKAELAHDAIAASRYNAKQLAIKVVCNSEYGASNNATFAHYDPDVAGAVTFSSRQLIYFLTCNLENDYLFVDKDFIESNRKRFEKLLPIGYCKLYLFNNEEFMKLKCGEQVDITEQSDIYSSKDDWFYKTITPTIDTKDTTFDEYLYRERRHCIRRLFDDGYELLVDQIVVIVKHPSTVCYQDTDSNYYKNNYIADYFTLKDSIYNTTIDINTLEYPSNITLTADIDPDRTISPERIDKAMKCMLADNEMIADFVSKAIQRRPYGLGFEGAFIVCRYLNRKKKYYGIKWGDDEELKLVDSLKDDAYTVENDIKILKPNYLPYWKPKTTVLPRPNGNYIHLDNQKLLYDNVNYLDYIKSQNVKCTGVDLARRDQYRFINYFHMVILQQDLRIMKYHSNNYWSMYKIDEPMKVVIDNVVKTFQSIINTNSKIVNFQTTDYPEIDFNILHFSKTAAYRLNKQNAVTTIVKRLREEGKEHMIPPIGERISFIVALDDETKARRLQGLQANKTNSERSYLVDEILSNIKASFDYNWFENSCKEFNIVPVLTQAEALELENNSNNFDRTLSYERWVNAKAIESIDYKYYLECLCKSTALYIVGDIYPEKIKDIDDGVISVKQAGVEISKMQAEIAKGYVNGYFNIKKQAVKRVNELTSNDFTTNASDDGMYALRTAYAKQIGSQPINSAMKQFIINDCENNINKLLKVQSQLSQAYRSLATDTFSSVNLDNDIVKRFGGSLKRMEGGLEECAYRLSLYRLIHETAKCLNVGLEKEIEARIKSKTDDNDENE